MRTSPKIKETSSSAPAKNAGSKAGSNFMEVVYRIVRRIPKGRATSYGAIAEASGIRLTARMVGWAMNAAGRAKPPVPAHRVVNSKGELSGRAFFATPTLMQELLEQEGVRVKNDRIEDFEKVFWDPAGKQSKTAVKPATGKAASKAKAPKANAGKTAAAKQAATRVGIAKPKAALKANAAKTAAAKPAATNAGTAKAKALKPTAGKKRPSKSAAPSAKPAKVTQRAKPGPAKQKPAPSPPTKKPR
ncbi:MGMT family protein [Chitinophaga sp.]|uniref:MGMT family protein n=1 Tax=Chitinophaga sp. TaxID=1869181 RepID=UPI0031D821B8